MRGCGLATRQFRGTSKDRIFVVSQVERRGENDLVWSDA